MAFEAVLLTRTAFPVSCIVANATGIEKGAILKGSDPNTVATSDGGVDVAGGILAYEKIASDGITQASVYKEGRFKVKISGNVTKGDPLVTDTYANHLKSGAALTAFDLSRGRIFGYAEETGTTGETIMMTLKIESGGSGVN